MNEKSGKPEEGRKEKRVDQKTGSQGTQFSEKNSL
ncbi:hypothetical protein EV198_2169 [Roseivirga ehrenbergii]|nr:hypothetical protein EV198_2169 [Roseivirga ehrenbergii]